MIIKKQRVRARGQAVKRFIQHVRNGEDNEAMELLRGNFTDVEDARADALRFGREYAIRAWSLSPERKLTDQQVNEMVDRVGREFGFDPQKVVLIRHIKARAVENVREGLDAEELPTDEHYHLLVPEVNPVDGGVLSSSHDYARHEKLARAMEIAWSHRIVPGPHMPAVLAVVATETPSVVAELAKTEPSAAPAPFDENQHQRLKRAGLDLPRLRIMISETLTGAADRAEFDTRMAAIGLRVDPGKKPNIITVETISGGIFVGSLARLTGLRQAALTRRMKFDGSSTKAEAHDSPSHVRPPQERLRAAGPCVESPRRGDEHNELPAVNRRHRGTAPADRGGNLETSRADRRPGEPIGRTYDREGIEKRCSSLKLAAALKPHQGVLLDLLGAARRSALPLLERASLNLQDLIEEETAKVAQIASFREPATLVAARDAYNADGVAIREIEKEIDVTRNELKNLPSLSFFDRIVPSSRVLHQREVEGRLETLERRADQARARRKTSGSLVNAEIKKFEISRAAEQSDREKSINLMNGRIENARAAQFLLANYPYFARWSVPAVLRLAASVQRIRSDMREQQSDNWDLVPTYDIWGIPHQPRPKSP